EDNRTIYENFAGPGEGSEGLDDALNAFTKGTLHVLLAALWDCVYEDQVTIEEWFWSGKHWQVFIGDFLVRGFNSEQTDYPANLFEVVEGLIKSTELNDELHWLRTFYCNIGNGNTQTEALLNNETWKAAESVISGADWQASQQFYSVRNYLMLTPKAT
ncbi:MAG: hypothetical protein GY927_05925, partial [bacterium]|nr:hypothetical protein [bacterium]